MGAARFFTWLSRTDFYAAAHAEAVALVPSGGRTWVDVGCGPGLLALLAARRGFEARGYDPSPGMVRAARREAAALGVSAVFEVAALEPLASAGPLADVVSAASLLAVLPRRLEALALLWRIVRPGGALLVVETMPRMRPANTLRHLAGRGALGLLLWGFARNGRSAAADVESFLPRDLAARSFHPLLGGLLGAWLLRRAPITPGERHQPMKEVEPCPPAVASQHSSWGSRSSRSVSTGYSTSSRSPRCPSGRASSSGSS